MLQEDAAKKTHHSHLCLPPQAEEVHHQKKEEVVTGKSADPQSTDGPNYETYACSETTTASSLSRNSTGDSCHLSRTLKDCESVPQGLSNHPNGKLEGDVLASEGTRPGAVLTAAANMEFAQGVSQNQGGYSQAQTTRVLLGHEPLTIGPSVLEANVAAAIANQTNPSNTTRPFLRYGHRENANIFVALASKLFEAPPPSAVGSGIQPLLSSSHSLSAFSDQQIQPHANEAYTIAYALRCKYPCYVVALLYLEKIRQNYGEDLLPSSCFHRLLCTVSMLAVKFYDDLYFSNDHYASGFRLFVEVLNRLEVEALKLLDFKLKPDAKDFKTGMDNFDRVRKQYCLCPTISSGLNKGVVDHVQICLVAAVNVLGWEQFNRIIPPGLAGPVVAKSDIFSSQQATPEERLAAGCPEDIDASRCVTRSLSQRRDTVDDRPVAMSLQDEVQRILQKREWKGLRYEFEEEKLHKRALFQKSQHLHRLSQEAHDLAVERCGVNTQPPPSQATNANRWSQQQQRVGVISTKSLGNKQEVYVH